MFTSRWSKHKALTWVLFSCIPITDFVLFTERLNMVPPRNVGLFYVDSTFVTTRVKMMW